MNSKKTEGGLLVAGINTASSAAYDDMMATKRRYEKLDRRRGRPICLDMIRSDIDHALTGSYQWPNLLRTLKMEGYQIKKRTQTASASGAF